MGLRKTVMLSVTLNILANTLDSAEGTITTMPLPPYLYQCFDRLTRDVQDMSAEHLCSTCILNYLWKVTGVKCGDTPDTTLKYMGRLMRPLLSTRNKRQATTRRRQLPVRKEYRMMTDEERQNFHTAILLLKNDTSIPPNAYDALALFHQYTVGLSAHGGPNFLGWHRIFLLILENALREKIHSVTIPYWDSRLDHHMDNPVDSIIWWTQFLGNGDGAVRTGPFANWFTSMGQLTRNIGSIGQLISRSDVGRILRQRNTIHMVRPLEMIHNSVHVWVGGHMLRIDSAAMDPVFFMHHAFIDYIWWVFQYTVGTRDVWQYPETDLQHQQANAEMDNLSLKGFRRLRNRDGYRQKWTRDFYTYDPAPSCSWWAPSCGSKYLICVLWDWPPYCISVRAPSEIAQTPSGHRTETATDTESGGSKQDTETATGTGTGGSKADIGTAIQTGSGGSRANTKTETDAGSGGSKPDTETATDTGSVGSKADIGTVTNTGSVGSKTDIGTETDTGSGGSKTDTKTATDTGSVDSKADIGTATDTGSIESKEDIGTATNTGSGGSKTDTKTATDTGSVDSKADIGTATDTGSVDSKADIGTATDTGSIESKEDIGTATDTGSIESKADIGTATKTGSVDSKADIGTAINTGSVESKADIGTATDTGSVDSKADIGIATDTGSVDSKADIGTATDTGSVDSKADIGTATDTGSVGSKADTETAKDTGSVESKADIGTATDTGSVDSKADTETATDTGSVGSKADIGTATDTGSVESKADIGTATNTGSVDSKADIGTATNTGSVESKADIGKATDTGSVGSKADTETATDTESVGSKADTETVTDTGSGGSKPDIGTATDTGSVDSKADTETATDTESVGSKADTETVTDTGSGGSKPDTETSTDTGSVGSKADIGTATDTGSGGSKADTETVTDTGSGGSKPDIGTATDTESVGSKADTETVTDTGSVGSKADTETVTDTGSVGSKADTETVTDTGSVGSKADIGTATDTGSVGSKADTETVTDTGSGGSKPDTETSTDTGSVGSKENRETVRIRRSVVKSELADIVIQYGTTNSESKVKQTPDLSQKVKDATTILMDNSSNTSTPAQVSAGTPAGKHSQSDSGHQQKHTHTSCLGSSIQNLFMVNCVSDVNLWVYLLVKVIHLREQGPIYHSSVVKNGTIDPESDIYHEVNYPKLNRYVKPENPSKKEKCASDNSGVFKVTITSYGLNYLGWYEDYVFVDNRHPIAAAVGYIAVKKPEPNITEVYLTAFDHCGRICRPKCLVPYSNPPVYKSCSGALRLDHSYPKMYGDTYGEAVLRYWNFYQGDECPTANEDQIFIVFYCDYVKKWWPWNGREHEGYFTKR